MFGCVLSQLKPSVFSIFSCEKGLGLAQTDNLLMMHASIISNEVQNGSRLIVSSLLSGQSWTDFKRTIDVKYHTRTIAIACYGGRGGGDQWEKKKGK